MAKRKPLYRAFAIDSAAKSGVAQASSRFGWAITTEPVKPAESRTMRASGWAIESADAVIIERPWGGYMSARMGLSRELGRWLEALHAHGYAPASVELVYPYAWQSGLWGRLPKHADPKAYSRAWAEVICGYAPNTQDECDAACMLHWWLVKHGLVTKIDGPLLEIACTVPEPVLGKRGRVAKRGREKRTK